MLSFSHYSLYRRIAALLILISLLAQPQFNVFAAANLTITPVTWNVVGLDSNNVNVGPNHFPIGARVCNTGDATATNLSATMTWDSANSYIDFRSGTNSTLTKSSLAANTCTDFYFEVEVDRDSNAYDTTRNYHITVTADGGLSATTPTPRTLHIEHLISQSRNSVSDVQYGVSVGSLTSVAAGGTMTLMVGNTYYIRMIGFTATQGYEQIESFINFPNTIFQVLSVDATYSAESSATLTPPYDKLYGDACSWENDPASANYRACLSTGKAGGSITVTYQVKILQVPSAPLVNPEPLSTLIYDFSGSSFHYNSDYSVSTRYAKIVNAGIIKAFSPKTINPGGTSTLTFTINNPGVETLANVNFADTLPAGMTISSSTVTYSGCGASPSPSSLTVGVSSLSFTNISVGGLSNCTVSVSVTSSTNGTHNNTSGNLFINSSVDTGSFATDSLVVSSSPAPPSSCTTRTTMATWDFSNYTASTSTQSGPFSYSSKQSDVSTATGTFGSFGSSLSGIANGLTYPSTWNGNNLESSTPYSNTWGINEAWLSSNPADPTTATTPYFQFQVDASQYGGVVISSSYNMQGNWSNSGNWYVLYSTNGTTWASANSAAWNKSDTWKTGASGISATTTSTSSTVYFRIFPAGAQYSGNPSTTSGTFYLDDVQITGCKLPSAPTLSKSFSPTSIPQGTTSTLTFSVNNPNATSSLSGVEFSDTLPSGLTVTSSSTSACGGTLTTTAPRTIALTGGTLAASGSCTINVTVTGDVAGSYTNISGNISSTESGANTTSTGYGTSSLTVIAPPVIAKTFTANPIFTGNTTTLTFSIVNPNTSATLTGVSFTDTLPAGLDVVNGSSSQCGGILTTTNNAPAQDTVSLAGGSLAAGASCSFSVTVTGTTAGLKSNSVTVTSTNGGTGNTSTSNVLVKDPVPAISLLKQVGPSATGPWTPSLSVNLPGNVYYRFLIENTGDVALTSVNLTDPSLTSPSPASCSWADGDGTVLTAPFNLPVADANDNQLAVCVLGPVTGALGTNPNTATASGTYNLTTVNDTSTATYTGTGVDLTVAKSNNVSGTVAQNGTFNWTVTVTNDGNATASFANTQVIMSDTLPGAAGYYPQGTLTETNGATPPTGTIDCSISGTSLTCVANGAVTLPASGSFNVTFTVTPTAAGSLANTANVDPGSNVSESNENNNNASDAVVVVAPPSISKSFGDATFPLNSTTTLSFTITNPNATTSLAGVAFSDTLPAGLTVADLSTAQCGGTLTTTSTTGVIALSSATIAGGGTCTFNITVTGTTAGLKNNVTGNVTSTNGGTGNTASASTTVVAPPTIGKNFSPDPINVGGTSTLTFTITNPNTGTALAGVGFTDPLPVGLQVASPPSASTSSCGSPTFTPSATDTTLTFSGGTIAASGTCTVSVNVTATSSGLKDNTSGNVSSTNGGTGNTANDTLTVNDLIDVSLQKQVSNATPNVGSTVTFTLVVANAGPNTATNVVVTDVIPAGYAYVAASIAGGDLRNDSNPSTTGLTWTINSLAPGASVNLTYQATVLASGPYDNYAEITSHTQTDSDSTPGNASTTEDDDDLVTVTPMSAIDVSLDKQVSNSTPLIGNTITFTLVVANAGPSTATNVVVTDVVPSGYTYVAASIAGGSSRNDSSPAGTGLTWTINSLASGASVNLSYQVTVLSSGVYNNYAEITSHTQTDSDSTPGNNSSTEDDDDTETVTPQAPSLAIAKEVSASSNGPWNNTSIIVNVGDTVYYRVRVTNTGNVTLTGLMVTDPMCTLTRGTDITGDNDTDFEVGEEWLYTCSVTAVAGTNNNTATADTDQTLPQTDDASYTAQQADLTVAKSNNVSGTIAPNGTFNWTITIGNGGTGTATFSNGQTIMSDPLPGAAGYYPQGALTVTNGATPPTGTISCTISGTSLTCVASGGSVTLPANASFSVTFAVTPTADGTLSNTATVDPNGNITESNEGNNTASDSVTVIAPPSISKSFGDATFPLNSTTTLSFTVTNPNTSIGLTGVAFTDTLPSGLTVVDSSTAQCGGTLTTTAATGVISLSGATIAANGSCNFSVTVTGSTAGLKNNTTGNVTSTNGGTGNTASASTTVVAPPSISKNFSPDPILVNGTSTLTFTITNSNAGTALTGVGFTDPLPAGLQVASPPNESASAGCGSPTLTAVAGNNSFSFGGGTIPAGGTCTVSVDVTATSGGAKNNTTLNIVSTNGGTGNTASDTLTVNTPSFSIAKVPNVASVNAAGDVINYTITLTNTGTATLTGVSVSDLLLTDLDCDGTPGAPLVTSGFTVNVGNALTCTGSYTVTQTDLDNNGGGDGDIDNIATGATNETSPQDVSAAVTIVQNPAHTTVKSETSIGPYAVGNTITYDIVVTNTGNITLTNVTVVDNSATVGTCTPAQPSSLAPNAAMTCPASHVVTQADVDNGSYVNTATGDTTQTPPSDSTVPVNFTQNPSLNIIKEVSTDNATWNDVSVSLNVGDTVYYRIRVANTGNVTLTNLLVNDGMAACTLVRGSDLTGDNDNNFEVGEEWQYTCSLSAVVGTNNNTATAITTQTPQDSDDASYTATVIPNPAMNITKSGTLDMTVVAPNAQANANDVINYTITVQNTGNQDLTGVAVSDSLLAGTLDCDGTPGAPLVTSGFTILVGNSLTCTGSYTLTQADLDNNGGGDGDIDNTATASSNQTPNDTASAAVPLPLDPAIDVSKTLNSATFNNPNEVRLTYTIDVQNTGNVTLTNIQVTDDLVAAFPGAASFSVFSLTSATFTVNPGFDGDTDQNMLAGTDTLNVGASGSITLVVDVDTGGDEDNYINLLTGFGTPPSGPPVQDDGQAGSPTFVDPALTKAVNVTQASVGDTVIFTITVTNAGNLPAPDVQVIDALPAMFDVTAVNVSGGPAGTVTTVNPPIGGAAPFTVTVDIGGPAGAGNNPLGVTDVVTIQITTVVNSLGNPPIVNNAGLTTTAPTNNVLNDADNVTINLVTPGIGGGGGPAPSLPATGFAPDMVTTLPAQPDELKYSATDVWLEIPSLGVKLPIVGVPLKKGGWDVSWLANQAGWLEGSAFPSWKGNSVLTGHVTSANGLPGPFANLSKLKYGDKVIVHVAGQKYIFEIRTNEVVSPNDTSAYRHEDKSWLTLITCNEFDVKTNTYKKRVIVRAVLVEVK